MNECVPSIFVDVATVVANFHSAVAGSVVAYADPAVAELFISDFIVVSAEQLIVHKCPILGTTPLALHYKTFRRIK